MRYLTAVLLMLLAVGSASAAMAPEVYEAARVDAADVIVIAIAGATPPPGADYGRCTVTGIVHVVERGTRYKAGDPVSLAVDCARPGADYPDGGALYEDLESLLLSTYGRAWLGPDGTIVLSQYQQLTEAELP
jgi:hypothetical protein